MYVHFEQILVTLGNHNIWIRVYQEKEPTSFANFGRPSFEFGNVQRVAKLTLQDDWLKLVTEDDVTQFWPFLS